MLDEGVPAGVEPQEVVYERPLWAGKGGTAVAEIEMLPVVSGRLHASGAAPRWCAWVVKKGGRTHDSSVEVLGDTVHEGTVLALGEAVLLVKLGDPRGTFDAVDFAFPDTVELALSS